ncbi:GNAT family N-acetyltransferase [Actinomycetota bacterium Odt1-20B]
MTTAFTRLTATELGTCADELAELLTDAVDGGASVGFLAPFGRAAAAAWWRSLGPSVEQGLRDLWVARTDGRLLGSIGLAYADKPNSRHRAEVFKLIVHREARGQGLGRALLAHAERAAADAGVTLLLLDTETDSPAELLYRSAGWAEVGVVPDHAADPAGVLRPTTFLYKRVA